jgi:Rrf2 family protein
MALKLSTRARYALRMMLDIAREGGEEAPVSLSGVSKRTRVSRGYLEQLALALRNAGLLKGYLGKQGGYRLNRPAREIHLREIVEAAIGPIAILDCLVEPETCSKVETCECRLLYALVNRRVVEAFSAYTLDDLRNPQWSDLMKRELSAFSRTRPRGVREGENGSRSLRE